MTAVRPRRRILFLITSMARGGAERQVVDLAANLRARGWRVTVVSMIPPTDHQSELASCDVELVSLGMRRGRPTMRAFVEYVRLVRRWRPDVVHAHMVHANLLARIGRIVVPSVPVISTIHSVNEGRAWRELAYRWSDFLSSATTAVSRAAADRYVAVRAVPEHRIMVIPNGFDLGRTVDVSARETVRTEHRIRQGKLLPYEPALRVPLLVRGPGIPAGEVRNDPVLSIDFAPTFLELSGAQPDPAHDGQSFLDPARPSDLTHDSGWDRVILTETGPRKLKKVTRTGTLPPGADAVRFTQGARTRRYLYVEHATGERELYDQRSDPGQLDSIVEDRRAEPIVEKMAALLARLRDCAGEECRAPSPHFVDRLTVAGAERDRPRRNGSGRVRPD